MRYLALLLVLGAVAATAAPARAAGRRPLEPLRRARRILFLGDSITYAGGYVVEIETALAVGWPGAPVEIINAGLPSETVSGLTEPGHAGGAFPRPVLSERLNRVLAAVRPDLVIACYGMNDGIYMPLDAERFARYRLGMTALRDAVRRAGAAFWAVTPPPWDPVPLRARASTGFMEYDGVLKAYSDWLILQRRAGWRVIDLHTALTDCLTERRLSDPAFTLAPDSVHLDDVGHRLAARAILAAWGCPAELLPSAAPLPEGPVARARALFAAAASITTDAWLTHTRHIRPGLPAGRPLEEARPRAAALRAEARALASAAPFPAPGPWSRYHGFDRFDLKVEGCGAILVTPRVAAPGRPWIWRAEFFDHRPELDLALLDRGWALAFIDVGNTFGAPSAMRKWNSWYAMLTRRFGLSPLPVLEGLSRGGLYVYNWAAAHPRQVGAIYGDNPVCDIRSWPGGKGTGPGSPGDWRKLLGDYGFRSEAEALAYRRGPIDSLAHLARAGVPIIHVAGDADEVVPYAENTVRLRQAYERLGGHIEVIVKPGGLHHPHGLDDPGPIIRFLEERALRPR